MLLFQLGLLALLLAVCSFAPGFFFVRRLPWNPLEKLCGSIGLSLILIYLAAWGIYCAGPRGNGMPVHPLPYAAVSLVCAVLAALCWRDMARFFRIAEVKRALAGFGFLLLWTAILNAIIRNFSGALWFGDWLEHFQRSLFFLQHFPENTEIFPLYVLPARPPMMNVLAAFFLAQTADRFEIFQAIFGFLNLLLFFPCYLLMPALGPGARRRLWPLVLLFISSPLVMMNTTYTWTKAAAAFYVMLALWLYLAGWRKQDSVRTTAAFVALAAGLVVHYSAGPYIAILVLHYLIRVWPRRPNKWRELAWITALSGLLVGTWLVWSMAVFGVHTTLTSNTTVTSSQEYDGSTLEKVSLNLYDTIVPVVMREPTLLDRFETQRRAGTYRDWFFVFYQVNAIFAMGVVGGPLVLWLAFRALRRGRLQMGGRGKKSPRKSRPVLLPVTPEQIFWRILIAAAVILGVAVVGERDPLGVGHLTLLALQVVGLTLIAAAAPWRRGALTVLILAGCAVDFSFGVLLQAHVEGLENSTGYDVYPEVGLVNGTIETLPPGPDSLSRSSWTNWFAKHRVAAHDWWFADLKQKYGKDPAFASMLVSYAALVEKTRANDVRLWQGWYGRHGGEVTFLGDDLAAWSGACQLLLIAIFAMLAGMVYWRAA